MRLSATVLTRLARMNNHFLNRRLAYRIGVAGTLPFLILMLACWLVQIDSLAYFLRGQLAYGIAILSFLGGVHWSAALLSGELSEEQTRKAFVWSVLPPVIAWSATLMGGFGFAMLMAGFIGAYQVDKRLFAWYRMPSWFLQLRLRLTCAVVAALALSVIAANVRG
ncbi:MAG TPA: DUF3429 domain-containing protein [Noviherbaspirillum sp.]|nr:DUF3429 domain-containing protein [Noviherbaspirillum sp.]